MTPADVAIHEALGITSECLNRAGVRRVSDPEARDLLALPKRPGNLAGIVYPYIHPITLQVVTSRVRRDHPEVEDGRTRNKYLSPYGDRSHVYFPPCSEALLTDTTANVIVVEAEKSVLSVMCAADRVRRVVLAVGLGGCWGWRGRIGKTIDADGERIDELGPLPDLDLIIWSDRAVVLGYDSNASLNPKVHKARRELAKELTGRGAKIRIAEVPRV